MAAIAPRLVGDAAPSAELVRERGQAALLAAVAAGAIVCLLSMPDRRRRFPFGGREAWVALALWSGGPRRRRLGRSWRRVDGPTPGPPRAGTSSRMWTRPSRRSPSDAAHFGTGASNRYDYWRVAWRTFEDDPIQGVGAGAFSVPWFRSRSIDENVTDAHSWQAAALAETGLVGLLLIGFVLLFPLARIRSARAGSGAWPIAAVALGGAAVYFVLHASVDWLFRIPAIAIPGFVVLGALATGGKDCGLPVFAGRGQRAALAARLARRRRACRARVPLDRGRRSRRDRGGDVDGGRAGRARGRQPAEPVRDGAACSSARRSCSSTDARRPARDAAHEATERAPQNWAAWVVLADAPAPHRRHRRERKPRSSAPGRSIPGPGSSPGGSDRIRRNASPRPSRRRTDSTPSRDRAAERRRPAIQAITLSPVLA